MLLQAEGVLIGYATFGRCLLIPCEMREGGEMVDLDTTMLDYD